MGGGRYFLNQVAHIRIFWLLFPPNEGTDALVISFLHLNEPIDSIAEKNRWLTHAVDALTFVNIQSQVQSTGAIFQKES